MPFPPCHLHSPLPTGSGSLLRACVSLVAHRNVNIVTNPVEQSTRVAEFIRSPTTSVWRATLAPYFALTPLTSLFANNGRASVASPPAAAAAAAAAQPSVFRVCGRRRLMCFAWPVITGARLVNGAFACVRGSGGPARLERCNLTR